MFYAASLAILTTMLFALVRAFLGPSVYDRILALNMFSTKTMLLIAVSGFLAGRPEWLDLALLYALHDAVGPEAIGAAINHLDEKDERLRINRVRYYTFDELRDGLSATLKSKRDKKAVRELLE